MASEIDADEAINFFVRYCGSVPVSDGRGNLEYGFEIWIPKVVEEYFRATGANPALTHEAHNEPIWRAFYDAAWEFCRRGILRPSYFSPQGRGSQVYSLGDGYSLTAAGREWLGRAEDAWFPTDAGRYISTLRKACAALGDAFTQRAHEAARCNESANYLACCVMCGAAAESALLRVGITKTGDEASILKLYESSRGRSRLVSLILGQASEFMKRGMMPGLELLKYWRDSAAHGDATGISAMEAQAALLILLRFSIFVVDNWAELVGA